MTYRVMGANTDVQTRHFANLAGAIVDAVELQENTEETFEAMDGTATVIRDDHGADVVLHDRGVTVHIRSSGSTDNNR